MFSSCPHKLFPALELRWGRVWFPGNPELGRVLCSAALCPSPAWGCREALEQIMLLPAAAQGCSGFLGDIHLLPVTSRFTPPPDAPCHGKPRPLPPTSVHAPGPAPAAAAAHSDLLLRPWSDEFWESWLPLPPWSSAPSAPSSSLFQHSGKPDAPQLLPRQECGVCSSRCSWERTCGAAELLRVERLLSSQKGLLSWLLCSSLSMAGSG